MVFVVVSAVAAMIALSGVLDKHVDIRVVLGWTAAFGVALAFLAG